MIRRSLFLTAALCLFTASLASADYQPFVGVSYQHVEYSIGAYPVAYDLVDIDLSAPGISFLVTESNGAAPRDTNRETTLDYVSRVHAQIGINANFFNPFDGSQVSGDPTSLGGLSASNGDVYSAWSASWPAVTIDKNNDVKFLTSAPNPATVYNAVAGNYRIVAGGVAQVFNFAPLSPDRFPDAHTAIGLTSNKHLLLLTVDGRSPTHSVGLSINALGALMASLGAQDAINLDGGGSTTMVLADSSPRVVNVPSGTLRPVGNNLAVFARPVPEPGSLALLGLGAGMLLVVRVKRSAR
ncbi:MAG: Exopolysaccharide biosynthesis protein related to N-acetylglucosamine-phosphodiester [Planctomycetota bacterium]|nr:Exopolysaccharide biosynthesis protein related to N-acetylglucosamine-phosphodiester [Planctomycetota bacterium]